MYSICPVDRPCAAGDPGGPGPSMRGPMRGGPAGYTGAMQAGGHPQVRLHFKLSFMSLLEKPLRPTHQTSDDAWNGEVDNTILNTKLV